MDKFQTNAAGNIDSGTEVLANNLVYMQNGTEKLFSDLFGRTFTTGIINTEDENTMFPLTANSDGTFNIGQGIGYIFDTSDDIYKKIEIATLGEYNLANTTQTTNDGTGNYILTPKSSGCQNIPIPNTDIEYEIWLEYLQICENGNTGNGQGLINYSIAKKISPSETDKKRFYQWADGYQVTLKPIADTTVIQGLCLGTVTKASNNTLTFKDTNRTTDLLIKSQIFLEYLTEGSGLTIGVDPITGKTKINVNVDNDSIIINALNQLMVSNTGSYPYTRFAINSGYKDGNNNADILTTNGAGITLNFGIGTQIPLVVNPAYNNKYIIEPSAQINISSVRDEIFNYYQETEGTYIICINNTNKDNNNEKLDTPKLELMKTVYAAKEQPTTITKGNIWLNLSVEPCLSMWYTGGEWLEYNGVPIGQVVVTSDGITVSSLQFNPKTQLKVELSRGNFYDKLVSVYPKGSFLKYKYTDVEYWNIISLVDNNIEEPNLANIYKEGFETALTVDVISDTTPSVSDYSEGALWFNPTNNTVSHIVSNAWTTYFSLIDYNARGLIYHQVVDKNLGQIYVLNSSATGFQELPSQYKWAVFNQDSNRQGMKWDMSNFSGIDWTAGTSIGSTGDSQDATISYDGVLRCEYMDASGDTSFLGIGTWSPRDTRAVILPDNAYSTYVCFIPVKAKQRIYFRYMKLTLFPYYK